MLQNRGPLFPLSYFGSFKIAHLHLSPQEPWKLCGTIAETCEKAPQIASEIHKPLNPLASSSIWQTLWEAATCRSSKIDASRKQRTLRTDVLISCSQLLDLWPKWQEQDDSSHAERENWTVVHVFWAMTESRAGWGGGTTTEGFFLMVSIWQIVYPAEVYQVISWSPLHFACVSA